MASKGKHTHQQASFLPSVSIKGYFSKEAPDHLWTSKKEPTQTALKWMTEHKDAWAGSPTQLMLYVKKTEKAFKHMRGNKKDRENGPAMNTSWYEPRTYRYYQ